MFFKNDHYKLCIYFINIIITTYIHTYIHIYMKEAMIKLGKRYSEAATGGVLLKKVFLEILQNS